MKCSFLNYRSFIYYKSQGFAYGLHTVEFLSNVNWKWRVKGIKNWNELTMIYWSAYQSSVWKTCHLDQDEDQIINKNLQSVMVSWLSLKVNSLDSFLCTCLKTFFTCKNFAKLCSINLKSYVKLFHKNFLFIKECKLANSIKNWL